MFEGGHRITSNPANTMTLPRIQSRTRLLVTRFPFPANIFLPSHRDISVTFLFCLHTFSTGFYKCLEIEANERLGKMYQKLLQAGADNLKLHSESYGSQPAT